MLRAGWKDKVLWMGKFRVLEEVDEDQIESVSSGWRYRHHTLSINRLGLDSCQRWARFDTRVLK